MALITIGEAAARLGLSTSALRYYDERGLVPVRTRQAGQRLCGRDELRRLAFIKIAHRLGIPLDTAAAILDAPDQQWRETVRDQIAVLEDLIKQAKGAQTFLTHALNCQHEHPARDCPNMTSALDEVLDGSTSVEETSRAIRLNRRSLGGPMRNGGGAGLIKVPQVPATAARESKV